MQIQVTVCDVDQMVGLATKRYTITEGDKSATVDLCQEHGAWLDEMLREDDWSPITPAAPAAPRPAARNGARKVVAPAKKTTGRRRSGINVTTLADIEAEKTGR